MRVEEIRINEVYKCKADDNNIFRYITEINSRGDLLLNKVGGDAWEVLESTIYDIVPVEASPEAFKALGAIKSPFGVEYLLILDGKEFSIKKDINSPLWVCSRLHKYRPPFVKFRFIHELQRYLLSNYLVTLTF